MTPKRDTEERFWEKVEKSDGCWHWKSGVWGSGYGFFWVGGAKRSEYAHRLSWMWANGQDIPAGLVVMHSCDNKRCVNPAHLSIGTHQENIADREVKERGAKGERNGGGRKLTLKQAREIRASQLGSTTCGRQYGVSKTTVLAIRKNKLWPDHHA